MRYRFEIIIRCNMISTISFFESADFFSFGVVTHEASRIGRRFGAKQVIAAIENDAWGRNKDEPADLIRKTAREHVLRADDIGAMKVVTPAPRRRQSADVENSIDMLASGVDDAGVHQVAANDFDACRLKLGTGFRVATENADGIAPRLQSANNVPTEKSCSACDEDAHFSPVRG